jgi:hypothetical protein
MAPKSIRPFLAFLGARIGVSSIELSVAEEVISDWDESTGAAGSEESITISLPVSAAASKRGVAVRSGAEVFDIGVIGTDLTGEGITSGAGDGK